MSLLKRGKGNKYIFYSFLIFLGLPGLMLALLAWRGIKNDQALVEREERRKIELSHQQWINGLQKEIESSVDTLLLQLPSWSNKDSTVKPKLILNILGEKGAGKAYWLFASYDKDYEPATSGILSTSMLPKFRKGWAHEFRQKDYPAAIEYHKDLLPDLKNSNERAYTLMVLARLFRKNGDTVKVIRTWEEIKQKYNCQKISESPPLGYIARLELAKIHQNSDQLTSAIQEVIGLLINIIEGCSMITREDLNYLHTEYNALLDSLTINEDALQSSFNRKLDSLVSLVENIYHTTNYLHNFRLNHGGQKEATISSSQKYMEIGLQPYLIKDISWNDTRLTVLFDVHALSDFLSTRIEDSGTSSWRLSTQVGETLNSSIDSNSTKGSVVTLLPAGLPPWKIETAIKPINLWSRAQNSSLGVFFYILVFLAVVLIFGLVFTLRLINSELRLSQLKSDFISTVSHEFRSPLTAIRQMSERLERERVPSEARKKEYYHAIHAQTVRLSQLVENILDFSRMETGEKQMNLKPYNINNIVEIAVSNFMERLIQIDFPIHTKLIEGLPKVLVDQNALIQVIENLLDNALKYAPSENGVLITTGADDKKIYLKLTDYGPGIPKQHLVRIFDRFYRAGDELTRQVKGSGIGLALVKKIMEAHNGEVMVESEPGIGTTFILIIPINNE